MDNIYRGERISKQDFINKLDGLKLQINKDLLLNKLSPDIVIEAANKLSKEIKQQEVVNQLIKLGTPKWVSEEYVKVALESLSKDFLLKKIKTELGENPFEWKEVSKGIQEKAHPIGTLLHIGAGNALGLSAFSVIEGLLTGNINILKLPENEGGLSSILLMMLIEIEPRLKPYIYVFDVSSKDKEIINKLIESVNAVIIWGSDNAIASIRQLVPPNIQLIEWGHRLSFAYFTKKGNDDSSLSALAKEICITDQLYCSSPQCVFYETDNKDELDEFAEKLAKYLLTFSKEMPVGERSVDIQTQITLTHELIKTEEILEEKRLISDEGKSFGVMVDYKPDLKPSPLFRNIWVMPIRRTQLFDLLVEHKSHLQTAGLSCDKDELDELSAVFFSAGVNRITTCDLMSANYSGEPHDGEYALRRYVRIVSRRICLVD